MKAVIQKIIIETPRVLTFIVKPEKPIGFHTGQAMRWRLPGKTLGRLYSVASPGGGAVTKLWFTIRIVEDGHFTPQLRKLKKGDLIDLTGPFGNFQFDASDPRDVGLIGGGSGISVLRAILHHVLDLDQEPKRHVHLVFSVLNIKEIIYKKELERLAAENSRFTYTVVVTEPHTSWKGACGFVTKKIFDKEFRNYQEQFYVCGPQPFIDCTTGLLSNAGVPSDRIHIDHWGAYKPSLLK